MYQSKFPSRYLSLQNIHKFTKTKKKAESKFTFKSTLPIIKEALDRQVLKSFRIDYRNIQQLLTNWPPYFEFSLQNTMHAAIGVIFQNNKNMIIALSYLNLSIASYYKQNEAKMSNILDPYSPIYSHFLLCSIYYHTSSANNHLMLLVNKTQFFKINLCHFLCK